MIEELILGGLLRNEEYASQVLPYIQKDYFEEFHYQKAFTAIATHVEKYKAIPSRDAIKLQIDQDKHLNDEACQEIQSLVDRVDVDENFDVEWLVNETEKFCKEKAVYNAVRGSIEFLEDEKERGKIPGLLSDALAVSFDNKVGHDYFEDAGRRLAFYNEDEGDRVPFDLEWLNNITRGGLPKKTLSVILASTGVGKSLAMCHMAAANLTMGLNVLYITMEMAEERISERIDVNLLDCSFDDLYKHTEKKFLSKIKGIRAKTEGSLVVKEYPTRTASVVHFRALLNELKLKRGFTPDIVYIDYINICGSAWAGNTDSFTRVKSIAEELRSFAMENDVPVISATQVNRGGHSRGDPELEDTAESWGLPQTADFMFAMIAKEELDKIGQILVKQLKNRFNDINRPKGFVLGIDRTRMRLYDVEDSAQEDLIMFNGSGADDSARESARVREIFGHLNKG